MKIRYIGIKKRKMATKYTAANPDYIMHAQETVVIRRLHNFALFIRPKPGQLVLSRYFANEATIIGTSAG